MSRWKMSAYDQQRSDTMFARFSREDDLVSAYVFYMHAFNFGLWWTMKRKPSTITISTLHDKPEIAMLIGCYVASFSYLEMTLWFYYASLLNTNLSTATDLMGEIDSIAVKLDSFERYVRRTKSAAPDLHKHLSVFERARRINGFRNLLMHGIYGISDATKELEVQSSGINPRKPASRAEPLEFNFLLERIAEVRDLTSTIWADFLGEAFPEKVPQEALGNA